VIRVDRRIGHIINSLRSGRAGLLSVAIKKRSPAFDCPPIDHVLGPFGSLTRKKFLDLGCQLGHRTIAAKDRGASLAVGYDLNPWSVALAKLISGYTYDEKLMESVHKGESNLEYLEFLVKEGRKPKYPRNLDFKTMDAANMKILEEDNSFDRISCVSFIPFLSAGNRIKVYQEMLRVGKEGALIHVTPGLYLEGSASGPEGRPIADILENGITASEEIETAASKLRMEKGLKVEIENRSRTEFGGPFMIKSKEVRIRPGKYGWVSQSTYQYMIKEGLSING
jgi:SAM-dependent methyltransferase